MKSFLLAVLLLFAPWIAKSAMAQTTTQCADVPVPTAWVATDQFNDIGQCNTPYPPTLLQANVLRITRFDNLLLGSTLNICSADYYPAAVQQQGWTTGPWHYEAGICGCPYPGGCTPFANNAYTITHQTCVNGQTNCYVPSVSASASQVTVPYGQMYGVVNATWHSPDNRNACVWVKSTYQGTVQTAFWKCGNPGGTNVPWSWVRVGGTTQFLLSMSNTSSTPTVATSGVVSGVQGAQPTLTITPAHVIVPVGQTSGPYTMAWSSPGYPAVDIWGHINNTGAWNGPVGVLPTSSTSDNLSVGTTYTYRTYAPGSPGPNSTQPNTGFLKEASVYASH